MSYQSIPNQPIIFQSLPPSQTDCNCNDSDTYKQLVDFDDEIFFQLESSPCQDAIFGGSQTVQAWTNESGTVTSDEPEPTGFFSQPYYPLDIFPTVAVEVVVTEITGQLDVAVSGTSTQPITAPGTHTLYFETTWMLTNASFNVVFTGSTFVGSFYVVSVFGVPNGGLFLGVVDPTTLEVIERIDPVITTRDQYLTAGFKVSDLELTAGCYRLAIAEYCTNSCGQYYIFNPYFNCGRSGVAGWSDQSASPEYASWTIECNEASATMSTEEACAVLQSVTEVCEDVEYSISIKVTEATFAVLEIHVDGTFVESIALSGANTYTTTFTPATNGNLQIYACQSGVGAGSVTITKVSLRALADTARYDLYSDVISVGDYDGCNYFKISGCNAEDQFGFAFTGTSFLPSIRLHGRKFRAQYPVDADLFRYASGRDFTSYADRRKKHSYAFDQLPEYVFDFLSIVLYFDSVYFNDQSVSPAESSFPEIDYNDANELGNIVVDMFVNPERVTKTVCSDSDSNCLPSILDLGDEPFMLYQDGERITDQSGGNLYYQS